MKKLVTLIWVLAIAAYFLAADNAFAEELGAIIEEPISEEEFAPAEKSEPAPPPAKPSKAGKKEKAESSLKKSVTTETPFVDIKEAPPLVKSEEPVNSTEGGLLGGTSDSQLLQLGVRTDIGYYAGAVLQQGFALPSVRLSAWGSHGSHISYRFSLGQTREFSSVMLPQIIPVEAWVDLHTASSTDWSARSRMGWKVGMFTPTYNPWWSPDYADMTIPIPDYLESHRAIFMNRELGTELYIEPVADHIFVTVGAFNGNGIIAFNTNASKAFSFSVQTKFGSDDSKFWLGVSAHILSQADPSSISFKNNGVWNTFAAWEYPRKKLWLAAELFGGELNDSTRSAAPFGGALMAQFEITHGLRWFSRGESMRGSGRGGNNSLASIQAGPVLDLHKAAQLYLLYRHTEIEDGTAEDYAQFRLRFQL